MILNENLFMRKLMDWKTRAGNKNSRPSEKAQEKIRQMVVHLTLPIKNLEHRNSKLNKSVRIMEK